MAETRKEEKIELIPVSKIKPLTFEVTLMGREEREMLHHDMSDPETEAIYNIDPIRVRRLTPEEKEECRERYPEVEYEIVDGHKRFRQAQLLHWEKIRAIVMDITRDEAIIIAYKKNKARGKVDPLLEALTFKYLYINRQMPAYKIAETFGLSESYVRKALKRVRISGEALRTALRRAAAGKPLSGKHLEAIALLPEEKQPELAKMIVEEKLGAKEAEVAREALEKGLPSERAVEVVKAVKKAKIPPKEAKKIVQAAAVKPEIIEELPKLPKEEIKARIEEAVRPPEDVFLRRVEAAKSHYPPIVVDYVATRYKGRHLEDVLKAVFWTLWSRLDEAGREEVTREAIRLAGEKGFELPIVG